MNFNDLKKNLGRPIIALTLLILCVTASAQQVTYQILEDNPEKAYTKFVAPVLGSDYNASNVSVYLGANARYGLTDLITLEGLARLDVYQYSGKGPGFHIEAGGFLPLISKVKEKEIPIILSYDPSAGQKWVDGQLRTYEETKSITIPNGKYINEVGFRGGLYQRRMGAADMLETVNGAINLTGVYLGGQWTSQAYLKAKINDDVERIGAGFTRVYGDILILPISNLSDPLANYNVKPDGTFGWRVGFQWYLSPHDGEYKWLANSIFTAEIGKKPLSGFNFNLSWGFALMNKR
jgi:hypothetical protein